MAIALTLAAAVTPLVITNIGTRLASEKNAFLSMKKKCKPSCKTGCSHYIYFRSDDLGWGAPGLGDVLGSGGEANRDASG